MSVEQIEGAIAQLPLSEFAQLWTWLEQRKRDLDSERETAYLLDNPAIKARLLEARRSTESVSLEEVSKGLESQ